MKPLKRNALGLSLMALLAMCGAALAEEAAKLETAPATEAAAPAPEDMGAMRGMMRGQGRKCDKHGGPGMGPGMGMGGGMGPGMGMMAAGGMGQDGPGPGKGMMGMKGCQQKGACAQRDCDRGDSLEARVDELEKRLDMMQMMLKMMLK